MQERKNNNQLVPLNRDEWYNSSRITELYVNGIYAEASILEIAEIGVAVSRDTIVMLRLRVMPGHRASFQTAGFTVVSGILLPRPGDSIRIKYDPADISHFVII
jgi:hypothetical protein